MLTYKPGMAFYCLFTTQQFDSGSSSDADSLPVAIATKNGIDDVSFVLTIAKLDIGRYKISGTIPLGYTTNDVVQISVGATVGGVSGKAVVSEFIIEEDSGANMVTITTQESNGIPIPDVSVMVFNTAETLKLKTGITDTDGQLSIALNDGFYKIRLSKAMVNFAMPNTLVVMGNTTKTCIGTPVSFTAPSAGLQTLVIYPADLALAYAADVTITAKVKSYNTDIDTAIITSQVLTAVNLSTHFEMQLAKGATVTIKGKQGANIFINKDIMVTDDDTANLTDYL